MKYDHVQPHFPPPIHSMFSQHVLSYFTIFCFYNPLIPISVAQKCMDMGPNTGAQETYLWPHPQKKKKQ